FDGLHRPHVEVQARPRQFLRLTKAQLHTNLGGIDRVNGVEQPEHQQQQDDAEECPAPAGQSALKLIAPTGKDVLERWRSAAAAGTTAASGRLPPGAAAVGVATPSARIIVPRHLQPFSSSLECAPYIGARHLSINGPADGALYKP